MKREGGGKWEKKCHSMRATRLQGVYNIQILYKIRYLYYLNLYLTSCLIFLPAFIHYKRRHKAATAFSLQSDCLKKKCC